MGRSNADGRINATGYNLDESFNTVGGFELRPSAQSLVAPAGAIDGVLCKR